MARLGLDARMWNARYFAIALALFGSEVVDARTIPSMFLGAWGVEGSRCGSVNTPSIKLDRHTLVLNNRRYIVRRIAKQADNVLDVSYRRKGKVWTDRLTVGTTGTRLFRERSGKLVSIYYGCEAPHPR